MPYYYPLRKIGDPREQQRTIERILRLRRQLDEEIPPKTATETLLLATWNVREFGDNRRTESLFYIAEIISRFNLVALQEVAADLKGLENLMKILGHGWDYIVTDSTEGTAGGGERTAFIYDKNKIFFRNIAGEIVLPQTQLIQGELQFARTPYCVAFQAGWFKFHLTTVHIYYGSSSGLDPRRVEEIGSIAKFLTKRGKKEDTSYILLGDFNIPKCGDAAMQALEKNGFHIPDCIKQHPTDLGKSKHYDQIAFNLKLEKNMTVFSEKNQKAGAFDFTKSVYTVDDAHIYSQYFDAKYREGKSEKEIEKYFLSKWRTFQMSDHLPLWVELKIDFSDQYLQNIEKNIVL